MIGHERTELAAAEGGPGVPSDDAAARDHRPVDAPDRAEPDPARRSPLASVWQAPLIVHVLLLVAVLVGVAVATNQPDSFTTDEGSYEVQLRALDQGSWEWDAGTAHLDPDPDGSHYPIAYSSKVDDGWVPIAKHPLWPLAALQVAQVIGVDHAYDVLGSLAVVGTALAAWFLAGRRDPGLRRSAFWLAGLAPVTLTATFGWAHGASAAAGGLAVLGAVALVDPDRRSGAPGAWLPAAMVAAGIALGILVRTEGLLLALALVGGLVVGGRQAGRSWRWSIGWGGAALVASAVVVKVEDLWIRSIIGTGTQSLVAREGGGVAASGFVDARIKGATRSLFDIEGGSATALVVIILLLAVVCAAYVARGEQRWARRWHLAMLAVILAFAFRAWWGTDHIVRGIVVAWPIMVIGVACAGAALWRKVALESTVVVLFVGAILATQYPDGGALQWGGRFFAPAVVPLALLAAVGVQRLLAADDAARAASSDPDEPPVGRVLVVALVLVPFVLGTWMCAENRSFAMETLDEIDAQAQDLAITPAAQIPRMMWRHDVPWLIVDETDEGQDLEATLDALYDDPDAPDEITLVMNGYHLVHQAPVLDDVPWRETGRDVVNGLTVIQLER